MYLLTFKDRDEWDTLVVSDYRFDERVLHCQEPDGRAHSFSLACELHIRGADQEVVA